jgi:hypothetical protein
VDRREVVVIALDQIVVAALAFDAEPIGVRAQVAEWLASFGASGRGVAVARGAA